MLRKHILLAADPEQGGGGNAIAELTTALKDIKKGVEGNTDKFKSIDEIVKGLQTDFDALKKDNGDLKRKLLIAPTFREIRQPGKVTTRCAMYIAACSLIGGRAHGKDIKPHVVKWARKHVEDVVGTMSEDPFHDTLARFVNVVKQGNAESNIIIKDALTTSEIPLPTAYSGEIVELVEEFGSFRRHATVFPMGEATVNLPKLVDEDEFAFIDSSGAVSEKQASFENVEFNAKKAGGMVRVPSELEMDSIVALGQFIARYIARQMASFEDKVGWLADGTATYKTLSGVVKRVVVNNKTVQLGAGLTASADITVAAVRAMRRMITNTGVLSVAAYYFHHTMESILAELTDEKEKNIYDYKGANGANIDGFPVHWINKLPVNSTDAIASTVVGTFGDMSYWYMGLRGALRLDTDRSVFFANDQVAVRGLERFTVNEMAEEHMSGLLTAS